MIPASVSTLFSAAGVRWQRLSSPDVAGAAQRTITSVSTDTREIGEGALFLGLSGPNFNGADFAAEAVRRGARAVLVEDGPEARASLEALFAESGVPVGTVADGRRALAALAVHARAALGAEVVAITGSVGKTTTKDILAGLARAHFGRVVASRASFNNDIGVPRTILEADAHTALLALEVGTNGPGEIAALGAIARPRVAAVTHVGRSHLEGLGSLQGVADEKASLLASVAGVPGATCVIGHAVPFRERLEAVVPPDARLLTVSADGAPEASLHALDLRAERDGTSFVVSGELAGALAGVRIHVPLLGRHVVHNVLVALAILAALGAPLDVAATALPELKPAAHRLEHRTLGGVTLIDDAYNANPESFRAALDVLVDRPGPRTLVMGAMGELGAQSLDLHAELGDWIVRAGIDAVVLVDETEGGDPRLAAVERSLRGAVPFRVARSIDAAVAALDAEQNGVLRLTEGTTVLVKASRAARLERFVDAFALVLEGRAPARASASGRSADTAEAPR